MERQTRAIGSMATAEKKTKPTTTKIVGERNAEIPGSVQRSNPVGSMTTNNERAIIKERK